jgi:lytic murein transglycosylase
MKNKVLLHGMATLLALGPVSTWAQVPGDFRACVTSLRSEATNRGISAQIFDAALKGVEPDPSVLEAMDTQPEFKTPLWDYMAALVDDQRIADGRAKLSEWASVLDAAEARFGVDRHVIVAVWGVESDYGKLVGGRPLVRSLATGACSPRRTKFFRDELMATLKILQEGDMQPEALRGSWAGAFGHTQFMPTTFQRLAVDFDGDGKRDIVGSIPDALGSTANYLARAGWKSGNKWGYEVRLPAGYAGPSGRGSRQSLSQWSTLGLMSIDGQPLSGSGTAALLVPTGVKGPAFLVFNNFYSIYAYNSAESYALAISHLSDRLKGEGALKTAWPTDDPGLSRAQRRELQVRLAERGFDVGQPDGAIGPRTRSAIRAYQASAGLPDDGHAGVRVLESLKSAAKSVPVVPPQGSVR